MKAYVIGNGPSRTSGPWDGFSIGCNMAEDTNMVVMTDIQLIDGITMGRIKPTVPVIFGPNAFDVARNQLKVFSKSPVGGFSSFRGTQNAGQVGVLWLLFTGFDEIHLIGFDSLWTGLRDSSTNVSFIRNKGVTLEKEKGQDAPRKWKDGWDFVFSKFPEANIICHCPKGAQLSETRIKRHEV